MAPRPPQRLGPATCEFALGDDVGLADQTRPEAASLDLVAKGRSRQPELGGSLGEGQPGSVLGRGEILRGLVGDAGRLELGVRSTKSPGRLDTISEWRARDQRVEPDLRDPQAALGFVDLERHLRQGLEVRHFARHLDRLRGVHFHNMARIGHECKASCPPAATVQLADLAAGWRPQTPREAPHDRQIVPVPAGRHKS
jgi:hypothetical protein